VLVSHAQGILGLVHDALAGAAMNFVVLAAADLVAERLSSGLVGVGHDATADLVAGVGEGLLHFFGGGFAAVGGQALLSLCEEMLVEELDGRDRWERRTGGEIFASCVRHDD
jgi:hypothetical protein